MKRMHLALAMLAGATLLPLAASTTRAQEATPTPTATCDAATPQARHDMASMPMSTPDDAMAHQMMDADLMYIDMMIPHHQSIIALAEAALPRLEDARLREIAQAVIATQQPEIAELRGYREAWYGDAEPMAMDGPMMAAMGEMLPGITGPMEEMAFQMDAAAQVAAFCAAANADLAFIDQTIPHHQMAIAASQAILDTAAHPELRDIADRVIAAQQREIEELTAIRQELAGAATPSA